MKRALVIFIAVFAVFFYQCKSDVVRMDESMKEQLKKEWIELISNFSKNEIFIQQTWQQIEQHYTEKNRTYHNLVHINNMLREADKFEDKVLDKEVMLFSIWFHDIIYDPMSKENEKESAEFAKNILSQTNLSKERIENCYQKILLTIKHQPVEKAPLDDKLLVDFDLEILSRSWEDYQMYSEQVRREYWMYPKPLFNSGRKKAMEKFLERPFIYQTPFYQKEKEAKARANIKREMEELL